MLRSAIRCWRYVKLTRSPRTYQAAAFKIPAITPKRHNFSNQRKTIKPPTVILALNILTWLGFAKEDEDKESELIMTLKRAVLCMKREQYEKAEQLLHIALRLAQQQENDQGVLYCYDLMANLAFQDFRLEKAENLFVHVLQMLMRNGVKEDDLKIIHISLKLARICQLKADIERAEIGYQWCLEKIENQKYNSYDSTILYGVIHDWYAQYLLDVGKVKESLHHLSEAYRICKRNVGENTEQSMLLLNDLGITCFRAGDLQSAEQFLNEGIQVSNKIEDKMQVGVLYANLGLILLQKGIFKNAESSCNEALKLGKKHENNEVVEQANYCFDQIKLKLGKTSKEAKKSL